MRVQTNGLPDHCYSLPSTELIKTQTIDFSVIYNPKMIKADGTSFLRTFVDQNIFDSSTCKSDKLSSLDALTGYSWTTGVSTTSSTIMPYVAGVGINGVLILASSSNLHDPYFPKAWNLYTTVTAFTVQTAPATIEATDACLGRGTKTTTGSVPIYPLAGVYHYKMLSPCLLNAINLQTNLTCSGVSYCANNSTKMQNYSISAYSEYLSETLIGVARDGHMILGPYTD
jgi:hypothetical protein